MKIFEKISRKIHASFPNVPNRDVRKDFAVITSTSVVVRALSLVGSVRLRIKRGSRKFPFIRARQLEPVPVGLATMHARTVARIQADIKHHVEVSLIRAVS